MAADEERRYVLGRLILDYIRTFMWPAVVLLAVVIYQDDLMGILKGRQFKAFGVEVGPAVEQIQQVEATTQQELADIAALVETLQASYERELAAVVARDSQLGPIYARAWEIVGKIEGHEVFLAEITR